MNALQLFLLENPVNDLTEEIQLPGRLKDFKIVIKAITNDQFNQFQTLCTETGRHGKVKFNSKKLSELVVVNGVAEPSLKDAEWIKKAGVADSVGLLNKYFLPGEVANIAGKITELSGFDRDMEEDMEEVKNS